MMQRSICALLAALFCLSLLAACGTAADTAAVTTDSAETAEETTEEIVTALTPALPDETYDGYGFTIYYSCNTEYGDVKDDFFAEEENGDPINDARFSRNSRVEEQFDIDITTYQENGKGHNDVIKLMSTYILAGDDAYDFIMACGYVTCSMAQNGYLVDLYNVPYLGFDMPWWDEKATEDLTVQGHLYYSTGDISTADNEATYCLMFNKSMFEDFGLESPYQTVLDGNWTIDRFIGLAADVAQDLNGDGLYDKEDRYGALIWDDTMMGIVNCTGEKCCTVDGDGMITLTLNSDRTTSILEKFFAFAEDKSQAYTYQRYNWDDTLLGEMFKNNQALFIMQLMQMIPKLRDMDADFGILPYFKYDEKQTDYAVTVGSWHSVFYAVPATVQDAARTGAVSEALAYQGQELLTPAYYDLTLKTKAARDNESADMLDIIFRSRVYDLGWYYQFGGYNEEVMNLLRNFKSDFSSMYAKYESKALASIEEVNNAFADMK